MQSSDINEVKGFYLSILKLSKVLFYFYKFWVSFETLFLIFYLYSSIAEVPPALPPLTPGTNRKVNEVLKASFASWEKEVQNCNITKGNYRPLPPSLELQFPCTCPISISIFEFEFNSIQLVSSHWQRQ